MASWCQNPEIYLPKGALKANSSWGPQQPVLRHWAGLNLYAVGGGVHGLRVFGVKAVGRGTFNIEEGGNFLMNGGRARTFLIDQIQWTEVKNNFYTTKYWSLDDPRKCSRLLNSSYALGGSMYLSSLAFIEVSSLQIHTSNWPPYQYTVYRWKFEIWRWFGVKNYIMAEILTQFLMVKGCEVIYSSNLKEFHRLPEFSFSL